MSNESDENEEFDGIKISGSSFESWEKSLKYHKKYTDLYNVLASEGKAIEAVSHLSNVREDLIRLSEKVKRKVNHQVGIYRNFFQLDESDSEEIQEVYREIEKQIESAFPYSFRGNLIGISEEKLSELTLKYCELKGISIWLEIDWYTDKDESYKNPSEELTYEDRIDAFTYTIYRDKEELEDYLLNLDVIESVIEIAISSSYPDELNKHTVREKNSKKKPGPKTPEELLDDIKYVLEEIINTNESLYDQETEEKLFNENGNLIINRVVNYVEDYPYFYDRWINEETAEKGGGYSQRTLKKHFRDIYEIMKSSNSS